ncbi:MAG: PDZ domain-containing protein, partial [Syntrophales bacterium LBB04]|nr:PDZ domain-containing protein [Syntrophales bacterium LBB04]
NAAGILNGDMILSIDGRQQGSSSLEDAVERIRGIIGTPVRLHLKRGNKTLEVNVIRSDVVVPEKG